MYVALIFASPRDRSAKRISFSWQCSHVKRRYHCPGVRGCMQFVLEVDLAKGREERGATKCACSYKARGLWASRRNRPNQQGNVTYFSPTETIRWIIFGSSGSSPDLGSRGVS